MPIYYVAFFLVLETAHIWTTLSGKILFVNVSGISSIIAFNAYITKHLNLQRNTPVDVVYDGVYYNFGNAYNPHSGFFTAPSEGLYVFTWTSLVYGGKIFDAQILVNGVNKGYGNCNNEANPSYANCANTVPLVLKAGDKVNIRTTNANSLHKRWSSFKGWRVK
ncbi:complement C1q-like protein 3 [Saccostrea echinata]|uniref:complement C1q-like protein 3 n=1 Tax=Saccostrea echinata TaxID=191078 RepID=UPI002A83CE48|nr:complement C1q-like protein 3 [Saccostrea echinata]